MTSYHVNISETLQLAGTTKDLAQNWLDAVTGLMQAAELINTLIFVTESSKRKYNCTHSERRMQQLQVDWAGRGNQAGRVIWAGRINWAGRVGPVGRVNWAGRVSRVWWNGWAKQPWLGWDKVPYCSEKWSQKK